MTGLELNIGGPRLIEMGLDLSGKVPKKTISKIYANSFLMSLTGLVIPSIWSKPDKNDLVLKENKINLLTEIIPEAWSYGHLALHNFTSNRLQEKINDPSNMDHGKPHLDRFLNNFFALLVYTTDVVSLKKEDLRDFVIAGAFGVLHDHVEIDAVREESSLENIKEAHAHLGAVNAAGVIRAMRLSGMPINERVEKLAFYAIYYHSYPLRAGQKKEGKVSIKSVLEKYPEAWKQFPVLAETQSLLQQKGASFEEIDVNLTGKNDQFMAKLLLRDVFSADKRDSMVPPFLAILRTLFTDSSRPFCEDEVQIHLDRLDKFLQPGYKPKDSDFGTDLDRIVFEFIRDYREEGMSGFAVEWLGASMPRKWEYVVKMTEALRNNDFSFIERKFAEYGNLSDDENFKSGLEFQRIAALQLMRKKSKGNILTASDLEKLFAKITKANRLPLLGRHAPFPDDLMPVFAVDEFPF